MTRHLSWPKIPLWLNKYDNNHNQKEYNLDNCLKLLAALGNPHQKLPPTIHIAGTNGKGSTVAMLKSIFQEANYKVHTYTSPHFIEYNERIVLNGRNITDSHLFDVLDRVKNKAEEMNIEVRFYEGLTIAAFLAFSEIQADILILETILGGALDSTNVTTSPIVTLITPISYDHTEYLGKELIQIAAHKGGIIKPLVPCVISRQEPEIYELLLNRCDELSAPAFCYEYDYGVEKTDNGFKYFSQKYNIELPTPQLVGDHQLLNAAAVIASIMLINNKFNITGTQITAGLTKCKWPGRIEKVESEKYLHLVKNNTNIQIYLDGAHNEAGAFALATWVTHNSLDIANNYLIIGLTQNRDPIKFCSPFEDVIAEGRTVAVRSEPSSYDSELLSHQLKNSKIKFIASKSLEEAIADIGKIKSIKPINIIITGSLFLISDFYLLLKTH